MHLPVSEGHMPEQEENAPPNNYQINSSAQHCCKTSLFGWEGAKAPQHSCLSRHTRLQQCSGVQVEQKLKFIDSKCKATVTDLNTRQQMTLYMHGNWRSKTMEIYLGKKKEGGRLIAEAGRKFSMKDLLLDTQEYLLSVQPGVDTALCVVMCVAFDEFNKES